MYWLLPRSHPGALTTHERAGVRFSCAQNRTLPHGPAARLLMVWMHLEAQRTGGGELALGRSLEAFARALDLDAAELAEQTERLCACTVSQEDWTCPIATYTRLAGAPALRLGAPLHAAFRAHRLEVSLPCLRELSGMCRSCSTPTCASATPESTTGSISRCRARARCCATGP